MVLAGFDLRQYLFDQLPLPSPEVEGCGGAALSAGSLNEAPAASGGAALAAPSAPSEVQPAPDALQEVAGVGIGMGAGDAGQADDQNQRCRKQFCNAFLVHGIKHVCDNAMKEILPGMKLRFVINSTTLLIFTD